MNGQNGRYGKYPGAAPAAPAPSCSERACSGPAAPALLGPLAFGTQGGGLANFQAEGKDQAVQAKVRQIGSKTFYFKENRWIDSTVLPEEDAKARRIRQFSDDFFKLARSQSAELNQYLTFSEPVTIKLADTVYRIDPAEGTP